MFGGIGKVSVLLTVASMLISSATWAADNLQQVMDQARSEGKPVLAVLGTETCGRCIALKRQLSGNLSSQLEPFVILSIDLNKDREMSAAWQQVYPAAGNGIAMPWVQVIAPNGQKAFDNQTSKESIDAAFLKKYSQLALRTLSPRQLGLMAKATEQAQALVNEGDLPKAITTIAPHLGSRGRGDEVAAVEALGESLAKEPLEKIAAAQEALQSDSTAIEPAITLTEVARIYGKLPAVQQALGTLAASFQENKDLTLLIKQAKSLDAASVTKSAASAKSKYRLIIRQYPDSSAAEYAKKKLEELEAEK